MKCSIVIFLISIINIYCFGQASSKNSLLLEKSLLPPVHVKGSEVKGMNLTDRMKFYHVPGVSITYIKGEKIQSSRSYGITDSVSKKPITSTTLFQAGSISKAVTAVGFMTLAEKNKKLLDEDIFKYIKGWHLAENKLYKDRVITARQLLSHSAGINLGPFIGYGKTDSLPSLLQILNGAKPANTIPVALDTIPGVVWKYSGGGYMILQKLMEDYSGKSLHAYIAQNVFSKLGMEYSFFETPISKQNRKNVAKSHDRNGLLINNGWDTLSGVIGCRSMDNFK
jgi:CubicO group peptidase (beta-lactamase class C family)